jgi:hypothetical protein
MTDAIAEAPAKELSEEKEPLLRAPEVALESDDVVMATVRGSSGGSDQGLERE